METQLAVAYGNEVSIYNFKDRLEKSPLYTVKLAEERTVLAVAFCTVYASRPNCARVYPTAGEVKNMEEGEKMLCTSDDLGALRLWTQSKVDLREAKEEQEPQEKFALQKQRKSRHPFSISGHGTVLTLLPRNRILAVDVADQGKGKDMSLEDVSKLLDCAEDTAEYARDGVLPSINLMRLAVNLADVELLKSVTEDLRGPSFMLTEKDGYKAAESQSEEEAEIGAYKRTEDRDYFKSSAADPLQAFHPEFDVLEQALRREQLSRANHGDHSAHAKQLLAATQEMIRILLTRFGEMSIADRKDNSAPNLMHDLVVLIESEEYRELGIDFLEKYGLVNAHHSVQGKLERVRIGGNESRYALCETLKPEQVKSATKGREERLSMWELEEEKPGFKDKTALVTEVTAKVIPFSGAMKPGEFGKDDLIDALRTAFESLPGKFAEVLDIPCIQAIIDLRWRENAQPFFFSELIVFATLLVIWTIFTGMLKRLQAPEITQIKDESGSHMKPLMILLPLFIIEVRAFVLLSNWDPGCSNWVRLMIGPDFGKGGSVIFGKTSAKRTRVRAIVTLNHFLAQCTYAWMLLAGIFGLFYIQCELINLNPEWEAFAKLCGLLFFIPYVGKQK